MRQTHRISQVKERCIVLDVIVSGESMSKKKLLERFNRGEIKASGYCSSMYAQKTLIVEISSDEVVGVTIDRYNNRKVFIRKIYYKESYGFGSFYFVLPKGKVYLDEYLRFSSPQSFAIDELAII